MYRSQSVVQKKKTTVLDFSETKEHCSKDFICIKKREIFLMKQVMLLLLWMICKGLTFALGKKRARRNYFTVCNLNVEMYIFKYDMRKVFKFLVIVY